MIASSPLLTDEDGAGVIEYALLVAIVSLALVVNLLTVDRDFCNLSARVAELMASSAPGCAGNPVGGGGNDGGGNNGNGVGNTGSGNQGNGGSNGNAGGGGSGRGGGK